MAIGGKLHTFQWVHVKPPCGALVLVFIFHVLCYLRLATHFQPSHSPLSSHKLSHNVFKILRGFFSTWQLASYIWNFVTDLLQRAWSVCLSPHRAYHNLWFTSTLMFNDIYFQHSPWSLNYSNTPKHLAGARKRGKVVVDPHLLVLLMLISRNVVISGPPYTWCCWWAKVRQWYLFPTLPLIT